MWLSRRCREALLHRTESREDSEVVLEHVLLRPEAEAHNCLSMVLCFFKQKEVLACMCVLDQGAGAVRVVWVLQVAKGTLV